MQVKSHNRQFGNPFRQCLAVALGTLMFSLHLPAAAQVQTGGQSSASRSDSSVPTAKPKVIVAKFHADWCGSCKAMGSVMEDLQNKLDGEQALFVTFDLTNKTTKHQSELLGAALGLEKLWADNKGSTGVIKVVNSESKEVIASFNKENNLKEMTAAITSAIK